MSAVPAVTFMGQASEDMDLDPFEVHVFPIAIRHLTSSPRPQPRLPQHPGGSPAATYVAMQTCTEPPTRDGLQDRPDKAAPPGRPGTSPGPLSCPSAKAQRAVGAPDRNRGSLQTPSGCPQSGCKNPSGVPSIDASAGRPTSGV